MPDDFQRGPRPRAEILGDERVDLLAGKKLVFLVGSGRSGTTWLELLLGRSTSVAHVFETHWFSRYMRSCFEAWQSDRNTSSIAGIHHILSDQEFYALVRQQFAIILARAAEKKPSATVLLEKSPAHALHWREILKAFPDAYFIHLIRDPRGVVASMLAASRGWGAQWAPRSIAGACEMWREHVESALEIPTATSRYFEVRYRELIECGPETLKRIFDWLNVEVDVEECRRFIDDCSLDHLKSGTDREEELLERLPTDFFREGRRHAWETELSRREIALVEKLTEPLMTRLGYSFNGSSTSDRMLATTSILWLEMKKAARWRLYRLYSDLS